MEIAYMITAYEDPQQLARLIRSLGNQKIFIHIDKKSDITPFDNELSGFNNVELISNRIRVNWGGWSQVEAQIALLKRIQQTGPYDRVVCLSGTDYVAYSHKAIEKRFLENPEKEYIRGLNISGTPLGSLKLSRYWTFDYPTDNKILQRINRLVVNRIIGKLFYLIGIRKKQTIKIDGNIWEVYFGGDYWSLTWETVQYVLSLIERQEIKHYFKHTYAPSELVITSIVCNSKVKKNVDLITKEYTKYEDLCSLHYEEYEPKIKIMDENDYKDIIQSGKLFFRKARTGKSDKLIEMINGKVE